MHAMVWYAGLLVLAWAFLCHADCPNFCNSESGGGHCVSLDHGQVLRHRISMAPNRTCVCEPGYGGRDCSFQRQTLFSDHDVYRGLQEVPVDLYGWNNDNTSIAFYEQLCEVRATYAFTHTGFPHLAKHYERRRSVPIWWWR